MCCAVLISHFSENVCQQQYNIELLSKLSHFLVILPLEIDAFEGGISMNIRIILLSLKKVMVFTREILLGQ